MELVLPRDPLHEGLVTVVLAFYVLTVIFGTSLLYRLMINRGIEDHSARYYNRKVIHALGGGVVALLTPVVYSSPVFPLLASLLLALFLLFARRFRMMRWFQTEDNAYEVNFVVAWGATVFVLWHLFGDPMKAVVPALFISFGDAVTGIVRNAIFGRRTKHWVGNVAMGVVSVPIGFLYAGAPGVIAAVAAAVIERFEFGPIDDNVLIAAAATFILVFAEVLI